MDKILVTKIFTKYEPTPKWVKKYFFFFKKKKVLFFSIFRHVLFYFFFTLNPKFLSKLGIFLNKEQLFKTVKFLL